MGSRLELQGMLLGASITSLQTKLERGRLEKKKKKMSNYQQSQHLKSLPSPLNKDTFLTCFSFLCVLGVVFCLFVCGGCLFVLQQHNTFPSIFLQKNETIRIFALKDIKLFSVHGKSFRSNPKVGKSCMIWNYSAVEP